MKIGIVAHKDRRDQAWRVFQRVRADFISIDEGKIGPRANHLRVWDRLVQMSEPGEWLVVLEDDAVLCRHFMTQLSNVTCWCPRDISVISLYMGRLRPMQYQDRMKQAVALAESRNACWITYNTTIHAVGLAMDHDDASNFMYHVRTLQGNPRPIDETMAGWCRMSKRKVGYCYPSIVNHMDDGTLIKHPDGAERQKGRVAWKFGGRDRWSRVSIPLDPNHP